MKLFKLILGSILIIAGIAMVGYATIMQCVLSVQLYGAIFDRIFIPDKSALFFLGFIPILIGYIIQD